MDVLNDLDVFRGIVESLGGDWSTIEPSAKAVKTAVEERRSLRGVQDIKRGIQGIIDKTPDTAESLSKFKRDNFRSVSKSLSLGLDQISRGASASSW